MHTQRDQTKCIAVKTQVAETASQAHDADEEHRNIFLDFPERLVYH